MRSARGPLEVLEKGFDYNMDMECPTQDAAPVNRAKTARFVTSLTS
jgi:hypothetical protein